MPLLSKLRGTIETLFQIGLAGPILKKDTETLAVRDPSDSAYGALRGLVFQQQQQVSSGTTLTIADGNTIVTVQDVALNGDVILEGTASVVSMI